MVKENLVEQHPPCAGVELAIALHGLRSIVKVLEYEIRCRDRARTSTLMPLSARTCLSAAAIKRRSIPMRSESVGNDMKVES